MKLAATMLLACGDCGPVNVGDAVTVDGMLGRGVVDRKYGNRVRVRFRNGIYLSRDKMYVHNLAGNQYKSRYYTGRS